MKTTVKIHLRTFVSILFACHTGTHWLYEILFRLQQGNLDSTFADKMDDFMDAAPNLDSLNDLKSHRILNTHLLPEFLSAKMLQNVVARIYD